MKIIIGYGRIDRVRFLAYSNIAFLLLGAIAAIVSTVFTELLESTVVSVFVVLGIVFTFKFAAQRYHDVGSSGLWALWYISPTQPVIFLVLGMVPGMKADNEYGSPNPEAGVWLKIFAFFPLIAVAIWIGESYL
ncbi:hypothetical protein MNBD_GAMMA12-2265 [hydrothermal vent metagenome]|uniref:DUF805 domain-containing protein n=1 Tax=hydrothermal vent metagenome TaxID=652676 RepID=A0A3B0YIJ8_9ZZZZ